MCGRPQSTSGLLLLSPRTQSPSSLCHFLVPSISSGPLPPNSCSPSTSQRSAASRLSGGAPTRPVKVTADSDSSSSTTSSTFRLHTLHEAAIPKTTTRKISIQGPTQVMGHSQSHDRRCRGQRNPQGAAPRCWCPNCHTKPSAATHRHTQTQTHRRRRQVKTHLRAND